MKVEATLPASSALQYAAMKTATRWVRLLEGLFAVTTLSRPAGQSR